LGYIYVETDARVTADGVAVAFHDDDLTRLAGRPGRISTLRWADVATARVGGEPIPRLDELLGSFPGLKVNVDPKQDQVVDLVAEAIRSTGSIDRVGAGSFSGKRLARLRRHLGPRLCTSLGPLAIARLRSGSLGIPVGRMPAPCVQVPVRGPGGLPIVDARFIAEAHRRDMQVHVWTVDDPAEMNALLDLGVDGIMTDRPTVLKEVLESRGQW
jgi:glycerophosphoryl diester phosphodiesterase